jgi:lipid II:glycine glycyltransferase (peptidoglycan interpeptide bridge formation enzyme)
MELKIFENKVLWNEFLDQNNYLSFLQDFEHGEIEKDLSREVLRLGLFDKGKLIGVCQIIGYQGKKKGLVVHHGPVVKEEFFNDFLKEIVRFLKENSYTKKYHFLRVNPSIIRNNEKILKPLGFILAPTYAVTENFWLKEIKNDEEMLNEMTENTKKLVFDSLKKPFLEIEKTTDLEKMKIFWQIYQDLAQRKNFIPYSKEFISKEFEIFSKENKALLFLGKVEGKYYSSALIIFSHQIAFYHHSASYPIKEPLNYKMQWEIIQEAKRRNCKFYNLWGIARKETKEHPWFGLTQFKKGFGDQLIKLQPTIDFPFSWKYYFSYLYEKIKRGNL